MFKNLKKTCVLMLLSLFIMPLSTFAYSDYVIAGGENIGIKLNSKGIMIVGLYSIGDKSPGSDANLEIGDIITSINDTKVSSINEMVDVIKNSNQEKINIEYLREEKKHTTSLNLFKDNDGVTKTGLYVKDNITGIGTLTFIDPESSAFGALGHEIIEKTTGQILEIKDGVIFDSSVVGIDRSESGVPGEKNTKNDINNVFGNVFSNTTSGIFGKYTADFSSRKKYKVASASDIKLGEAKIRTVLEDKSIKEYSINITKLNKSNNQKTKNILFEITDQELLDKTGGIVQGMSGSPIIQGEYIIGAVTHVVVENPKKGYGIIITNMLEEAEKVR